MNIPTSEDFQNALNKIFADAWRNGEPFVDVKAGDLHRVIGGYPGTNHRMPLCCHVMRKNMKEGDEILNQPPKGNGASLVIQYHRLKGKKTYEEVFGDLVSSKSSESKPRKKATYKEIQQYIKRKYGFTVKSCWIAHAKEIFGLNPKISHRRLSRYKRVVPCPIEKLPAIEDAFKHFKMI
jgi:hypothetical protein